MEGTEGMQGMEQSSINTGDTFLGPQGEKTATVRSILGVLGIQPQAKALAEATIQPQAAIRPQAIRPQAQAEAISKSSGWSKFYSRKTGRAYWHNCNTGEQN